MALPRALSRGSRLVRGQLRGMERGESTTNSLRMLPILAKTQLGLHSTRMMTPLEAPVPSVPSSEIAVPPRAGNDEPSSTCLDPTGPDETGWDPIEAVDFPGLEALSSGRAEADTTVEEPRERPKMDDRWFSVGETTEYLGISKNSVYAWIEKKVLPGHRIGRLWKFKRSEVDEWVYKRKAADAQRDHE